MQYHGIEQITVKSLFSPFYKLGQQKSYSKNSLSFSKKQCKILQRNKDKRENTKTRREDIITRWIQDTRLDGRTLTSNRLNANWNSYARR